MSVVFSATRFASFYNYVYVVGQYLGSFWLILNYTGKKRQPLFLLKAFLLSAFIVASYGIFQYVAGTAVFNVDWVDVTQFPELKQRAYSTLQNPTILGSFLILTVAYCLGLFSALPGGKRRLSLILLFLTASGCLLLTFSRGNWVSLIAVLFVYAAFFYRKALMPFLGEAPCLLILPGTFLRIASFRFFRRRTLLLP